MFYVILKKKSCTFVLCAVALVSPSVFHEHILIIVFAKSDIRKYACKEIKSFLFAYAGHVDCCQKIASN